MNSQTHTGEGEAFGKSWSERPEAHYTHWTREEPANQIQLAFRQHWLLFQEIMKSGPPGRRVLEVGCGRGSIGAYFADAGFDTTLLDISPDAIEVARNLFAHHGLKARFDTGDALSLPYPDGSFDVVVSIGLLEHFEDVNSVIKEQVRVLDRGGLFLGYIVPELPDNVQKNYLWVNELLRAMAPPAQKAEAQRKTPIYRSDALSPRYLDALLECGVSDAQASGVYPLPMISCSPEFPFTLLNPECERILVKHFSAILDQRRQNQGRNPWLCDEGYGQAVLAWGRKG